MVHFARLLAALLFGAVVFQAAQSLQVPAYEPRLVGLWALGALVHGYLVRGLAPMVVGLVAGLTWVIWSAAWTDPSALGIVLGVALAGTGAVPVAALHTVAETEDGHWTGFEARWREAGALALLGALFAAALPFLDTRGYTWPPSLVALLVVTACLVVAAVALTLRRPSTSWAWAEPLGAAATTLLALVLLAWDAGADVDAVGVPVGPTPDWPS